MRTKTIYQYQTDAIGVATKRVEELSRFFPPMCCTEFAGRPSSGRGRLLHHDEHLPGQHPHRLGADRRELTYPAVTELDQFLNARIASAHAGADQDRLVQLKISIKRDLATVEEGEVDALAQGFLAQLSGGGLV